jgi:putative transposase
MQSIDSREGPLTLRATTPFPIYVQIAQVNQIQQSNLIYRQNVTLLQYDQGSQFTSDAFVAAVATSGARLSMDGRGAWTDNIFIERFWRSLKYEEVYLTAYDTVADAKRWIYRYIEKYNTIRPHSSLEGKAPDKIHAIAPAEGLLKAS